MKILFLFICTAFIFSTSSFSQSYESSIIYNKKKQRTIAIDYAYPQEAVQNAIVQKLEKSGNSGKEQKGLFNKDKGFIVFEDAYVTDISDDRMDYILKIERKSRKDKDETTLYLILNKANEDAIPAMDAYSIGKAKSFLNNLLPEIEDANLELQIKEQEDAVGKADKKFKNLKKRSGDCKLTWRRIKKTRKISKKKLKIRNNSWSQ